MSEVAYTPDEQDWIYDRLADDQVVRGLAHTQGEIISWFTDNLEIQEQIDLSAAIASAVSQNIVDERN